MRMVLILCAALAVPLTAGAEEPVPINEATCAHSTISALGHRLQDGSSGHEIPDSGSALQFANGLDQVGYDELPQVGRSRIGDPVIICLIRLPQNCPAGDDRGRIYTTTNLRTLESWTLPDAAHSCGGA